MDWISQFEAIARNSPCSGPGPVFRRRSLGQLYAVYLPDDADNGSLHRGKARGSKRKGIVLSLFYVLGLAIVYSSLGISPP